MATDVCIAGGGPAGLAAALALRKEGFTVAVVDCAVPPIDKACGEGLMPDSLDALRKLGVELDARLGFQFKGIRFHDARSTVGAAFPNGEGLGIRRSVLHSILVKHAEAAGVQMIWGAKNVRLAEHGLAAEGEDFPAPFVIGADGLKSNIRHSAGLEAIRTEKRRYGFRRHYKRAPWSHYVELYWGKHGQVYVTPIAADEICVAFLSKDPKLRLDRALEDFPPVLEQLAGAEHSSHEMGALSLSRSFKRIYREGLALLGDASGSVDAVTGEGMCLAFKQARALAEALRAGHLRQYANEHKKINARPLRMASLMLTMERHSGIQRRALAALAKRPQLFSALLSLHVGQWSAKDLRPSDWLGFGVDFLTT